MGAREVLFFLIISFVAIAVGTWLKYIMLPIWLGWV